METIKGSLSSELILARFDPGEKLLEGIRDLIKQEHLHTGVVVSGIGTLSDCRVHETVAGYPPNLMTRHQHYRELKGSYEIASIQGIIADGEPHLHITLCEGDTTVAGHVEEGCIVLTLGGTGDPPCGRWSGQAGRETAGEDQAADGGGIDLAPGTGDAAGRGGRLSVNGQYRVRRRIRDSRLPDGAHPARGRETKTGRQRAVFAWNPVRDHEGILSAWSGSSNLEMAGGLFRGRPGGRRVAMCRLRIGVWVLIAVCVALSGGLRAAPRTIPSSRSKSLSPIPPEAGRT